MSEKTHDDMLGVRATMQPLELLDLRKVQTVSELVDAMSKCSFGARQLGEATATLHRWIVSSGHKPAIVCDGESDSAVMNLLRTMQSKGWFSSIYTTEEFASRRISRRRVLVVGNYMERYQSKLYEKADELMFVNASGQVRPGQVKDGYFPNFVPSDPAFILPIMFAARSWTWWGSTAAWLRKSWPARRRSTRLCTILTRPCS